MQARTPNVTSRTRSAGRRWCRVIAPGVALIAALIASGTLAGCASPAGARKDAELSGMCQFRACVCVADDAPFWTNTDMQPVLWDANGAATCPTGQSLKLGSAKK